MQNTASISTNKTQHNDLFWLLTHSNNLDSITHIYNLTHLLYTMGLTTVTAAAILAFNALIANAQNYQCECDGLNAPVWKDCKETHSSFSYSADDK